VIRRKVKGERLKAKGEEEKVTQSYAENHRVTQRLTLRNSAVLLISSV
jgi:hypothetical protein